MSTQLITHPIEPTLFMDQNRTLVAWLGMAGAMINVRGTVLLIDPLISTIEKEGEMVSEEGGYPLKVPLPIQAKDLPRADLVMYTHGDDDHFGRLSAKILADYTGCRFAAPAPVARGLRELNIPADRIQTVKEQDRIEMGQARITVTPAMHDWQEVNPWKREDCCGYLIDTPDGRIWHPGDTRKIDDLLAFKNVDVMFFDVAAVSYHLGPEGSAWLAKSCGARLMIAYHYGTLDLEPGSFANCDPDEAIPYVKDLPGEYLKLNPGEVLAMPIG